MRMLCAWMVLSSAVAFGGEEASVLVSAPTPVIAQTSCRGCKDNCCKDSCCTVYNTKVEEKSSCRRALFGRVIKRDVKRTVLTPVR